MDSGRSTGSQEESEFILQVRLAETLKGLNDSNDMPQLMSINESLFRFLPQDTSMTRLMSKKSIYSQEVPNKTNTIFMGL